VTAVLPAISTGHSATLTIPAETSGSGGALTITLQTTLPASIPAPASIARLPKTIGGQITSVVYITVTPTAKVSFNATPAFSFTLPSSSGVSSGSSAWIALYDPTQSANGWVTLLGPGTVNGQTVTFASSTNGFSLSAGTTYVFSLFTTSQTGLSASACSVAVATPAPSPFPSPTPIDANHVALQVRIDPSAQTGRPCVNPNNVNVYIYGQSPTTGAYVYVSDAQGDTQPASGNIPAVSFCPGQGQPGVTCGGTSQVIQLPNLNSARVYMSVNGALAVNPPNGLPAPWGASSFTPVFDWFEYTLPANGKPTPSIDINSTQIQMIGLDYTLALNGTQRGLSMSGLLPGFMTQVYGNNPGTPWSSVMFAQWPTRILGPNAVQYSPGGNCTFIGFVTPCGTVPTPSPGQWGGQFLDGPIQTAWNTWAAPQCLEITYNAQYGPHNMNPSRTPVWGQVDAQGNFNFYDPAQVASCAGIAGAPSSAIVATLPNPFNASYQTLANQALGCNTGGTWFSATSAVLIQSGPFVGPVSVNTCTQTSAGPPPMGAPSTVPLPQNTQGPQVPYPGLAQGIGNIVSTAINRGLFSSTSTDQSQPECPGFGSVYTSSRAYLNQYAATLWKVVHAGYTPKVNGVASGVYAIPFDDQCGYSSDLTDTGAQSIIVTINGN